VDPALRVVRQAEWNKPTWWPMALIVALLLVLAGVARRGYRARQRATALPVGGAAPLPVADPA
jgi:hypothetical protein